MTENDRRLLESTAAAMKLLLDSLVQHRVTMVDQERAQALSAQIGAALPQPPGVAEPAAPVVSPPRSGVAGSLRQWWVARRLRA